MQFVATLTHSPDNCWARSENEEKADEWVENMQPRAEEAGVGLLGGYVAPNEHTFYFVLESDSFESVTEFLGPPLLQDHDADISPVMSFEEIDAILEE